MKIGESMLPEFDHEMANTRKTIERVSDEKFDWKPHEKSPTMGWLAGHLANLPSWAILTIDADSFDMSPLDGQPPQTPKPASTKEALEMFDSNVAKAREALANVSNEELMKNWSLLSNGNTILSLPKISVIRSFVLNHIIHHRAQLGVYLRLNDLPVPSIYGPSADESM